MITDSLLQQRGHLFCWVPLCLGIGIGGYFSLRFEPTGFAVASLCIVVFLFCWLIRIISPGFGALALAVALVCTGGAVAKLRTDTVAAPVLGFRYYGPIEGRIIAIDRSSSDAVRLTLDHVILARMSPDRTPERVRVSLHGEQPIAEFMPGDVLILTGHLSPPSGPAEPGGYDFQRHAWFAKLGAVGYTRTPVLRIEAAALNGWRMQIFAARIGLSRAVQETLPGEVGAFAAAIMSGDRSQMSQQNLAALRASNLAHLLAISGLHMGLLTAFVFGFVRALLICIPVIGLRWPVKKIAAGFALIAGAFYLALSGGNVATERAYIMVAVMFCAVILGKQAITLRAVAIAATLILLLHPEALTGPGFQMSFAATTALVAVFRGLKHVDMHRVPKWAKPALSLVISSFVAGMATAPFAAAHFNQFAYYGLIANLLSVPLMGLFVMPAAVLAVCLAPFGLWDLCLWVMGLGLRWIMMVAQTVSALDGAVGHIVSPTMIVLPILTIGLLWGILWQGKARVLGAIPICAAGALWMMTERPKLLVADSGSLLGVMTQEGRALSKPKGNGFVAGVWLENDGAPVLQSQAAERPGFSREGRVVETEIGPWAILQVSGKTALAELQGCGQAAVLIANNVDEVERPCLVFDIKKLRQTGALAMTLSDDNTLKIVTSHQVTGRRPWNMNATRDGIPNGAILKLDP